MARVVDSLKYLRAKLFSQREAIEKRITYAMVLCAMLGEFFGFIESFFLGLPTVAVILPLVSFLFLIILSIWGFRTKRPHCFAIISISFSALIFFPLMFFSNAGLHGGMPYYFIVAIVCEALALRGRSRIIIFSLTIFEYTGLFFLYRYYPQGFLAMSHEKAFVDQLCSMLITSIILFSFAFAVSKQNYYDREKIQQLSNLYEKQANTDELTGLFNRRYFNSFLKLAILTLGDTGMLHIAMFDIDDFKYVNDKFGHPFGDKILKHFANVLLKFGDANGCTACRYGGEEFILLIPKKDKNEAIQIVENILEYTRTNIRVTDDRCITVSAGLKTCTDNMSYEDLIQAVDNHLYTAKCTGKNRLVY